VKRWHLLILLSGVLATGCSALTPFATEPLAAKPGQPPGTRVGICYNTLKTSQDKVKELAQAECPGDTVAEQVDTDYRMDDCPLFTPGRASFVCKPAK
jgi:hypothetical protein